MRFYLITLMAISLAIIIIIQNFPTSEAKKIKLKDLKKAKKYAYFLATRRKKFYAIPFPVPLPVFVKRQQIYTQVPVVPRYVEKPYHVDAHDPYTSPSEQYSSEVPAPKQQLPASGGYYYEPDQQQQQQPNRAAFKSGQQLGGKSGKYLAHIANIINQAYPGFSGGGSGGGSGSSSLSSVGQREIVGKLMSGQAKILLPGTLLSTLRKPQQIQPPPESELHFDHYNSTGKPAEPANKPSASELHMSSQPRSPTHLDPFVRGIYRGVPVPVPYMHAYRRLRAPTPLYPLAGLQPLGPIPMIHPHHFAGAEMLQSAAEASSNLGLVAGDATSSVGEPIGADSQESAANVAPGQDYELMALARQRAAAAAATEQLLIHQAHRRHRQQQAAATEALRSAVAAAAATAAAGTTTTDNNDEPTRIAAGIASGSMVASTHQQLGLPALMPEQLEHLMSY